MLPGLRFRSAAAANTERKFHRSPVSPFVLVERPKQKPRIAPRLKFHATIFLVPRLAFGKLAMTSSSRSKSQRLALPLFFRTSGFLMRDFVQFAAA